MCTRMLGSTEGWPKHVSRCLLPCGITNGARHDDGSLDSQSAIAGWDVEGQFAEKPRRREETQ
jgi:hypothetical protein